MGIRLTVNDFTLLYEQLRPKIIRDAAASYHVSTETVEDALHTVVVRFLQNKKAWERRTLKRVEETLWLGVYRELTSYYRLEAHRGKAEEVFCSQTC